MAPPQHFQQKLPRILERAEAGFPG